MAELKLGSPQFIKEFTRFLEAPTRKAARQVLREHPELARYGPEILDKGIRAFLPPLLHGPDNRLLTEGQARTRLRVRRALLARHGRRPVRLIVVLSVLAIAAGVSTFLLVNRSEPARFGPDITLSPDGKLLASVHGEQVFLWDVAGHRLLTTLNVPGSSATAGAALPAFSPDGALLGVLGNDGNLYIWNVAAQRRIAVFADPDSAGVSGFAFSPDRRTLATFDAGDYVYIWDIRHQRQLARLAPFRVNSTDNSVLSGLAYSADGQLLATSLSGDSQYPSRPGAVVWNVATRRIVAALPADSGGGGLAFSPDGRTLALGDDFGAVTLWDLPGKTIARTLNDAVHGGGMCYGGQAVVYSTDGTMLATDDGCANHSIFVWDPRSGQQVTVLLGQTSLGNSNLAFSPDSKTLFASSAVGGVDRWDIAARTVTATFTQPSTG